MPDVPPEGGTLNTVIPNVLSMHEALQVLLSDLVDYAGLFPPAELGMEAAARNYADYLHSPHAWMLGRFVVPVARLSELERAFEKIEARRAAWRLSVLCGANVEADVRQIVDFNHRHAKSMTIDAVEIKASGVEKIQEAACVLPPALISFYEIEANANTANLLAAIAAAGGRAKFRTGGVVPEMFPSIEQVAYFIQQCHTAGVPFKATAGLHHPLRGVRPLTYERDGPTGVMHGFLNVFLAACFVRQGLGAEKTAELLAETSAGAFDFGAQGVRWREMQISAGELRDARRDFALSFGSCSFVEPVEDLQQLRLL